MVNWRKRLKNKLRNPKRTRRRRVKKATKSTSTTPQFFHPTYRFLD